MASAAKLATSQKVVKAKHFHLPAKEREQLTLNLMLLLKASIPLGEAFRSLKDTTDSKLAQQALTQMERDIDNGLALWQTMERAGVVSQQTLTLIKIGEQSGKLIDNLKVAADQEQKQTIFHAKVRAALLYPVIVLGITLIVGLAVSWFLLPKLAVTFSQLQVKLPLISRIFLGFGDFLKHNGLWAVPAFLATLALGLYLLFFAPKTRTLGQRLLLHIPGIKGLVKDIEIARFGYLLGGLLDAGLTVMQAWDLLANATSSPRYQKLYAWLHDQFENGYSFRASFATNKKFTSQLLPVTVQRMVIAAERSGTLPETLQEVGKIYEERADIATTNLESTLEPILLVFVAAGVLAVAIAVILPIYSLLGGLN